MSAQNISQFTVYELYNLLYFVVSKMSSFFYCRSYPPLLSRFMCVYTVIIWVWWLDAR